MSDANPTPRTPRPFKQEEDGDTTLPPPANPFQDLRTHVNTLRVTGHLPSAATMSLAPQATLAVIPHQTAAVSNLNQQFNEAASQMDPLNNHQLVLQQSQESQQSQQTQTNDSSSPEVPRRQVSFESEINTKWFGQPNKFNGAAVGKAQEWLNRMKLHINALRIPNHIAPAVAASFMEGAAIDWAIGRSERLSDANHSDSWKLFEQEFRDRYIPVERTVSACVELFMLRMGPKQTALDFVNQFDRLREDAGINDRSVLAQFMLSLTPSMKEAVLKSQPKSYHEAKSYAISYYAYSSLYNSNAPTVPAMNAMDGMVQHETLQFASQMPNASRTPNPQSSSGGTQLSKPPKFCTHCKKYFHTIDRCYKLHPELRPPPDTQTTPTTKTPNASAVTDTKK